VYINCSFYDIMKLFNCIWSLILQHWIARNVYIYCHDITDILLKVVSNTRTLTFNIYMYMYVLLFLFIVLILQRRQCYLMKKEETPYIVPKYPHFLAVLIKFETFYLSIGRNFCSVHEERTSIRLYTLWLRKGVYNLIWGYFEWTEQNISINPYKLIQIFFAMIFKNILFFSN
jgi:hypothetical protein